MISVIGEEYVAFSETSLGQFSPLIAVAKYDGAVAYRDIVRDDLLRIPDTQVSPGGWLFRKTQNAASSWIKRFCLIRGDFLLLFHSPQNEKPIGIVPLNDCRCVMPDGGKNSFDEQVGTFRANEGFEFDIRHTNRPTVRFYALSNEERNDWMKLIKEHVGLASLRTQNVTPPTPAMGSNITITATKLTGLSLGGESSSYNSRQQQQQRRGEGNVYDSYQKGGQNAYPYSPPPQLGQAGNLPWQQQGQQSSNNTPFQSSQMQSRQPFSSSSQNVNNNNNVNNKPPPFAPHEEGMDIGGHAHAKIVGKDGKRRSQVQHSNEGRIDFSKLEKTLNIKFKEQNEARRRESVVREK